MKTHKLSDVQTKYVGEGTYIWQYSVVLSGAKIGRDCNICSHCFIENDVFIGPNVTFTNVMYPRSRRGKNGEKPKYPKTIICEGASIGGGATILPGIMIGKKAIVGAGAVVTKNIKDGAVVYGDSAKYKRIADDV
jgi:acetyltransferase-like isoleucine patch superfamily enzyme